MAANCPLPSVEEHSYASAMSNSADHEMSEIVTSCLYAFLASTS
jgi:hypothetical protein